MLARRPLTATSARRRACRRRRWPESAPRAIARPAAGAGRAGARRQASSSRPCRRPRRRRGRRARHRDAGARPRRARRGLRPRCPGEPEGIIGAAHAGWRGLAGGRARGGREAMRSARCDGDRRRRSGPDPARSATSSRRRPRRSSGSATAARSARSSRAARRRSTCRRGDAARSSGPACACSAAARRLHARATQRLFSTAGTGRHRSRHALVGPRQARRLRELLAGSPREHDRGPRRGHRLPGSPRAPGDSRIAHRRGRWRSLRGAGSWR